MTILPTRCRPGLLAVALVLTAGCAREPARPNLVLISIDTLRADHLGAYGYARETSPAIDALARQGVVFERAYSTSNWTLPAHASMLTGLYPTQHGVFHPRRALAEGIELLPQALGRLGYRSAGAVSAVAFLQSKYGFARGWEAYDDSTAYPKRARDSHKFVSSELVHRRAVALLDQLAPGPFFLFLHYFDVHGEYRPPPPYDRMFGAESDARRGVRVALDLRDGVEARRPHTERQAALYDGEIRWVDSWIGELLGELDRRQLSGRTLVVLTADHGEEFLEHGELYHGRNLYDTSMRVPLVVRFPGGAHAGRRVETPVSLVDLGATLLAAAGSGTSRWRAGRNLAGLLDGDGASGFDGRDLYALGNGGLRKFLAAIVGEGYKAVFRAEPSGRPRGRPLALVRVGRHPFERELESPRLRVGRRLQTRLLAAWNEHRRGAPRPITLARPGQEEEAGLRALGYL